MRCNTYMTVAMVKAFSRQRGLEWEITQNPNQLFLEGKGNVGGDETGSEGWLVLCMYVCSRRRLLQRN